jgi:hypothetical protein
VQASIILSLPYPSIPCLPARSERPVSRCSRQQPGSATLLGEAGERAELCLRVVTSAVGQRARVSNPSIRRFDDATEPSRRVPSSGLSDGGFDTPTTGWS